MSRAHQVYRSLGIRHQEARTVWLFFLHNFFLGIGTILVYVSANVILLENHPETSLPIAYVASAAGMMLVGRVYSHFEHHLALRSLTVRVLLTVIVLTAVIAVLVVAGYSVWAAVSIMVGYRMIYLLTNLEFWGVSALVFDVRQGKRLFSVISSGDMPAKAIGAVLAALVHAHTEMASLLLVAFAAFLAAISVLNLTFRSHDIHTSHGAGRNRRETQPAYVEKWFGNSRLIGAMCLSLIPVAAIASGIEYAFFINVKYKIHAETSLLQYVGKVLALTYFVAMGVKLLVSRQALDRLGIRNSLQLLPLTAFAGFIAFAVLWLTGVGESTWLFYYCALYLTFEVLRRSLFDPVFLVLFQPLTTQQRLKGHTLVKGYFEPLGMALAGVLIYAFRQSPELNEWIPFVWMGVGAVVAVVLLRRTYFQYLDELKSALGRRFMEGDQLAVPDEMLKIVIPNLSSSRIEEVLNAVDWLKQQDPKTLAGQAPNLLRHEDARVRRKVLEAFLETQAVLEAGVLHQMILSDPEPVNRELAAQFYCRLPAADPERVSELLFHADLSIRKGAIQGSRNVQRFNHQGTESFVALANSDQTAEQKTALELIGSLQLANYSESVGALLQSRDPEVVAAAIRTAGLLKDPGLTRQLPTLLGDKTHWRSAARSLSGMQGPALPLLEKAAQTGHPSVLRRIAGIYGKIDHPDARRLLTGLVGHQDLTVRLAALRALGRQEETVSESPVFQAVLEEEMQLAQRLLHGSLHKSDRELLACLDYEMGLLLQRVFYLLMQLYDREVIDRVRVGLDHVSRERRANALEMLENLIPRWVYQCLQAIVDNESVQEKVRLIDAQLGPFHAHESLVSYILHQGVTRFTDWTISVALRHWSPRSPATAKLLSDYLHHPVQILSESAAGVLDQVRSQHPEWHRQFLTDHPTVSDTIMKTKESASHISDFERVMVLKSTRLFADTPANVLSSIAPIMKEVTFPQGQPIFQKGEIGNCMFVIYSGTVDIYDRQKWLARFEKGDVFGELALLDSEPRSASAVVGADALLFRIDQEDFYDLMEERDEVLRNVIRILCQRIRSQNEKLQTATFTPGNG
ncbi:cyclic nucleotide-binding domain-containing protein [Larkinella soli]|uniref:cyclic nucleotide-binding domain-containing protein n=1 Tax=Larkinella soli TaxID=1770527 RepID=UPI000FFC3BB4|nr:cyclic nucleotide-binding domain-containing protein [Larkinella soli]